MTERSQERPSPGSNAALADPNVGCTAHTQEGGSHPFQLPCSGSFSTSGFPMGPEGQGSQEEEGPHSSQETSLGLTPPHSPRPPSSARHPASPGALLPDHFSSPGTSRAPLGSVIVPPGVEVFICTFVVGFSHVGVGFPHVSSPWEGRDM